MGVIGKQWRGGWSLCGVWASGLEESEAWFARCQEYPGEILFPCLTCLYISDQFQNVFLRAAIIRDWHSPTMTRAAVC